LFHRADHRWQIRDDGPACFAIGRYLLLEVVHTIGCWKWGRKSCCDKIDKIEKIAQNEKIAQCVQTAKIAKISEKKGKRNASPILPLCKNRTENFFTIKLLKQQKFRNAPEKKRTANLSHFFLVINLDTSPAIPGVRTELQ
jgi:hypothetical protein